MKRSICIGTGVVVTLSTVMALAAPNNRPGPKGAEGIRTGALVHVEAGPVEASVLYANGNIVQSETQRVTRPMCGSDVSQTTLADVTRWAETARAMDTNLEGVTVISPGRVQRGGGMNVVFNLSGSPPVGTAEALDAAATYIESQFSDSITITISCSFADMGSGVLGATSTNYVNTQWPTSRDGLIAGKDADDTIQDFVPNGTTWPVRYDSASATITQETRVWVSRANYNATIGSLTGTSASMQFNNQFPWDFDPTNGITGGTWCFQSVVIHEVGHGMGFTSGADFRTNDSEMLDVFRFERLDGSGDYNPDTEAEFQTTPRLVDFNAPNDDHNSDTIAVEYRMSDGSPYQASHFREQSPNIGIMDPALGGSSSFYPDFFRASDLTMFDAIGYDYPPLIIDVTPPSPNPMSFSVLPSPAGTTATFMQAVTASDPTGPVEYLFQEMTGNPGSALNWQSSALLNHTGLVPNTLYQYRVSARDAASTPNQTSWSAILSATTFIENPTSISAGTISQNSIQLIAVGPFTNLSTGASGLFFDSTTSGGDGGLNSWTQSTSTTAINLQPNTEYTFRVKARNQNNVETSYSPSVTVRTARAFVPVAF